MVVKAKVTNQARKEENVLGEVAALGIVLAQATVTKHHRPGRFNNRSLMSHRSRGWKSKIEVQAGLVSSEASWLIGHHLLPVFLQGLPSVCVCALISFLIRIPGRLD